MTTKPSLEEILFGSREHKSDSAFLSDWKERTSTICKPCWELKYCPYGPLVEHFPLLPITKTQAAAHNSYLEDCLETGSLSDGRPLDDALREEFEHMLKCDDDSHRPDNIPPVFLIARCNVFGHICPVFFMWESYTETKDIRRHTRYIPRDVMLKVVRRDGQVCQQCYRPVPDTKVEFDHIIPFSKGGPTSEGNLRLLCKDCNRSKTSSLGDILGR